MTAPVVPPERYTTLGLHHGMHVHDTSLTEPEHVVDQVRYVGNGDWAVSFSDCSALVVCGARHGWVEEPA